jgi:L-2-hydroxyglutarate oxidase LhgO
MEKVDITIIGAGVVGLATAYELSKSGKKNIVVVEKNVRYGSETSSRNSEVIHSGIYYPPGSLKAQLCVKGNRLLYEICEKNGIPHRKIGKLIVALDEKEFEDIHKLKQNGQDNGVAGLEIIGRKKLEESEPNISGYGALLSPETGIIDSEKLMHYFYSKATEAGVICVFDSKVAGITATNPGNPGYRIKIERGNYGFESNIVINSAGLYADRVAGLVGLDVEKLDYTIKYCKGEYFKIGRHIDIQHLIYPVPDAVSLGIHLVMDLAGEKKLGPNAIYTDNISYDIDESNKKDMYGEAVKYIPSIKMDDLTPDTCGIRPKLQGEKEPFRDFIIKDEAENGYPGFINLLGIESPGLTASPVIAGYVRELTEL